MLTAGSMRFQTDPHSLLRFSAIHGSEFTTLLGAGKVSLEFVRHCRNCNCFVSGAKPCRALQVRDETLDKLSARCRHMQRLSLSWCGAFSALSSACVNK